MHPVSVPSFPHALTYMPLSTIAALCSEQVQSPVHKSKWQCLYNPYFIWQWEMCGRRQKWIIFLTRHLIYQCYTRAASCEKYGREHLQIQFITVLYNHLYICKLSAIWVQNAAQSSFTTMIDANASQPSVPIEGTKTTGIAQCCLHWNSTGQNT